MAIFRPRAGGTGRPKAGLKKPGSKTVKKPIRKADRLRAKGKVATRKGPTGRVATPKKRTTVRRRTTSRRLR